MKISCDIIKDLLPLYVDGACSKESAKLVEEHLKECPDCTNELGRLKEDTPVFMLKSEENIIGAFRKSTLKKVLFAAVCLIVFPLLNVLIFAAPPHTSLLKIFIISALILLNTVVVPTLAKRNRKKIITVFSLAVPLIIFVLLTVGDFINYNNFSAIDILFAGVFSLTYFGLSVAFTPVKIRADYESPDRYKKTALKIGIMEAIILIPFAFFDTLLCVSETSGVSFRGVGLAIFNLIFIWAGILIFRFVKNDSILKSPLYTAAGGLYFSLLPAMEFPFIYNNSNEYLCFWQADLLSPDHHRLIANISLIVLIISIVVSFVLYAVGRWKNKVIIPENSLEDTAENTPDSSPENNSEDTAETAPDNIPENNSEDTAEITPDSSPENKE